MRQYHKNPRQINDRQFADLRRWLRELGDLSGVVHDLNSDEIIAGNQRSRVFDIDQCDVVITQQNDEPDAQGTTAIGYVVWDGHPYNYRQVRWSPRQCEKANIIANKAGGDWDFDLLADHFELPDLFEWGFAERELDLSRWEEPAIAAERARIKEASKKLADRFIVPPFSVLDARQGYWQDRKRAWLALGIEGAAGRGPGDTTVDGLCFSNSAQPIAVYLRKNKEEVRAGRELTWEEFYERVPDAGQQVGMSVFDPVLCEVSYRWFLPPGGSILDPFAGEATKGIVAAYLGYEYTGIELRPEQVEANDRNASRMGLAARWITGDSINLDALLPAGEMYDLVFTSPPYYDLEIYSESAADGSSLQTYEEFMDWYRHIFTQAVGRLRENRFLIVKVGEIRERGGRYRGFVRDNMDCFIDLGLAYINEAVLITQAGSLPVRVSGQFPRSRKLGKTHQNVLMFFKGDPSPAVIQQELPLEIDCSGPPGTETD